MVVNRTEIDKNHRKSHSYALKTILITSTLFVLVLMDALLREGENISFFEIKTFSLLENVTKKFKFSRYDESVACPQLLIFSGRWNEKGPSNFEFLFGDTH